LALVEAGAVSVSLVMHGGLARRRFDYYGVTRGPIRFFFSSR